MDGKSSKRKEQGMIVTTISLPNELYRRLKIRALDERRPFVEVVRQALTDYLSYQETGRPPRKVLLPSKTARN